MSVILSSGGLDWQFVIVTLAAAWGGWVLLRPLWPSRSVNKAVGACGRCSSPDCAKDAGPATAGLVSIGSGAPRKPRSAEGSPPRIGA